MDTPLCSSKDLESYNQAVTSSSCYNDIDSRYENIRLPQTFPYSNCFIIEYVLCRYMFYHYRSPYEQYTQLPSEPASPPMCPAKHQNHSNTQQLPTTPRNKAESVTTEPLIEINDERPKNKKFKRMESVPETSLEISDTRLSSASSPSVSHKSKKDEKTLLLPESFSSPEDILTQKLLETSANNEKLEKTYEDAESSNDDTQMTDDENIVKSNEKLYNGNVYNENKHNIV